MDIVTATRNDISDWLGLRRKLWPHHSVECHERDIRQALANPTYVCLLAVEDGLTTGFIEVQLRDVAEGCRTSPVAYIEGWYVSPKHQRSGVGRRLMGAAETWARSEGCREIASDAEIDNELSHKAHLGLGFSESARLAHFRKNIAESGGV
ncbi:MAG: GNAT family N-acetyltransferase [Alphaproteobacteria bacterium]|nr:GNAT family N-acetyltransferase [Alphaproteobacteria bacterium]